MCNLRFERDVDATELADSADEPSDHVPAVKVPVSWASLLGRQTG